MRITELYLYTWNLLNQANQTKLQQQRSEHNYKHVVYKQVVILTLSYGCETRTQVRASFNLQCQIE